MPRILAAHSGRCLLSGNPSSQRNRGQRPAKAGCRNRLGRIRRLRTNMAAARLPPKFRRTSSWRREIPFWPSRHLRLIRFDRLWRTADIDSHQRQKARHRLTHFGSRRPPKKFHSTGLPRLSIVEFGQLNCRILSLGGRRSTASLFRFLEAQWLAARCARTALLFNEA